MNPSKSSNSLVLMGRASQMLAEATTLQKAKELKDLALTAADWARRKKLGDEVVANSQKYARLAQERMGELLQATERAKGRLKRGPAVPVGNSGDAPTLSELGVTRKESMEAQAVARLPGDLRKAYVSGELTLGAARRELKRVEVKEKLNSIETLQAKELAGKFDVMVIDPPWPLEKIERDLRPNQVAFDYPTMTLDEIRFEIGERFAGHAAENCHVFLWVVQRYLPTAIRLLEAWGLKYVCCFGWLKPGGFQPVGLPQYNLELCLYARRGSPSFTTTKNFLIGFEAERTGHSVKPAEFYETLTRVTAGRRLDMFNRRAIPGFEGWGKESS